MKALAKLVFILILLSASNVYAKANSEFPPSITELTIPASGDRMSGLIYQAAGKGPHPTVILLHGYPGNEKNLDVAQALRSAGWNVLFFHYRGAWGSEGQFSYRGAEQDVQTVLAYLQNTENAKSLRVDQDRVSLIGHSMGGHMAIAGTLDNPTVRCAISYDGANLGANGSGLFNDPETAKMWKDYGDSLFMLNGWSGQKAQNEIMNFGKQLDLTKRAGTIDGRPVLLIAADSVVIPLDLHIDPLLKALDATEGSQVEYKLINDDHSFSASRKELIKVTTEFLNERCQ